MNKKYYYVVRKGRTPGIYLNWEDCRKQVDRFRGAQYRKFENPAEAFQWLNGKDVSEQMALSEVKSQNTPIFSVEDIKFDYIIYTDGSCLKNPAGPGGWAFVVSDKKTGEIIEHSGGEVSTTNNRMELTAAIQALAFVPEKTRVSLYTDSQYLKNGITSWIKNWKKRGWKRPGDKPVLNLDLWKQLDVLNQSHNVSFKWVKGHVGNPLNERCDKLAKQAAMKHVKN
ncbi:ribonuclease HI [Pseudoramibacter sp.]|jgi:ribonuclease HI|uniref:ribonuclease HI n=1 Tax=Pseudoramibacter sp. TaxID=2034862 RepID=UPI0025E1ACA7|nr:ribonuclease HI [Pseudoramibacter sp.]MCH4071841.1 ribonuclease HI [Pseudoramibacter sp.]MCH4105610.1 ribonuclease HI [Pseudoramibacter sp.]